MNPRLDSLPEKGRRGSRARCLLLTDGPDEVVAERLNRIVQPLAWIDPSRDRWMPRGPDAPAEARLGDAAILLSDGHREAVTSWWLVTRAGANTPNWDLAATAAIGGRQGLVLIEAKAHDRELKPDGKSPGNAANHSRIGTAIGEANQALNALRPGWALSRDSHYQLANRFAGSWKLASLGVPVVLVYLGFLNAEEMGDQGAPLASAGDWLRVVLSHSCGIVPESVWETPTAIGEVTLVAAVREFDLSLGGAGAA